MPRIAALLLIALAILFPGCGVAEAPQPEPVKPAPSGLRAAVAYLWSRQAADGGWHSETYGLLRSGQSLSPFVLAALLEVPPEVFRPDPRAHRARGRIPRASRERRRRRGAERPARPGLPQLRDGPDPSRPVARRRIGRPRGSTSVDACCAGSSAASRLAARAPVLRCGWGWAARSAVRRTPGTSISR